MAEVLALLHDREAYARLLQTTRARVALTRVACEAVLEEAVRARPVTAVVIAARNQYCTLTVPTIRRLRASRPAMPILAYVALDPTNAADVIALAQAGVSGLVFRGVNDLGVALRAALERAEIECTVQLAMLRLSTVAPPETHAILEHCLQHGHEELSVESLALAIGVHRRTLVNRLTAAGLPGPHEVIGWCRLVAAATMLQDPRRAVEQVAAVSGFGSGPALANMLRRYTGLRPSELRTLGGVECVLDAFVRDLRMAARSATRSRATAQVRSTVPSRIPPSPPHRTSDA